MSQPLPTTFIPDSLPLSSTSAHCTVGDSEFADDATQPDSNHCTVGERTSIELEAAAQDGVTKLLEFIGEDPARHGLQDTPARFARALKEMTCGYQQDPEAILGTRFPESSDRLVIVRGIHFNSLCEHHLLGFNGTVTLAYRPRGRMVVGLSKLPKLVVCFARRLQIQERMTTQIADAIEQHLNPLGIGVVVTAHHSCMGCRGAMQPQAEMITTEMRGEMLTDMTLRQEFYSAHV